MNAREARKRRRRQRERDAESALARTRAEARATERDARRVRLAGEKRRRDDKLRDLARAESKEREAIRHKFAKERAKVWEDYRKRTAEIRATEERASRSGIVVTSELPT